MKLTLALKAFLKAFKDPKAVEQFLEVKALLPPPSKGDQSHLRLLSMLQQSGRLVDFLEEDISNFNDAQVGAAVRKIHEQCKKTLEDIVTVRPIFEEKEGATITVPEGYNPSEIKVVGKVKGEPPFKGVLRHKGWKAHKLSLPKEISELSREVICPAEVEIV
jgi:hypothetical protein